MREVKKKENRQYKDSVFVDLFHNYRKSKEYQIMLCNALFDTNYKEDEVEIEDIRIDDTLYKNFRNDIALGVNRRYFVFGEHQSTLNLNMPLRHLLYLGRTYEKTILPKNRHMRKKVRIAYPRFYVFYNGIEEYPLENQLRLSDSFVTVPEDTEEVSVELIVKVININLDKKHPILEKCPILKEYMQFVDTVRRYTEEGEKNPVTKAVRYCIANGILADYLRERGSEVENMLIGEYSYEEDIAVQREEAYEDGYEIGVQDGIQHGETRGIELAKQVLKLFNHGLSIVEIACQCQITEEKVKEILA